MRLNAWGRWIAWVLLALSGCTMPDPAAELRLAQGVRHCVGLIQTAHKAHKAWIDERTHEVLLLVTEVPWGSEEFWGLMEILKAIPGKEKLYWDLLRSFVPLSKAITDHQASAGGARSEANTAMAEYLTTCAPEGQQPIIAGAEVGRLFKEPMPYGGEDFPKEQPDNASYHAWWTAFRAHFTRHWADAMEELVAIRAQLRIVPFRAAVRVKLEDLRDQFERLVPKAVSERNPRYARQKFNTEKASFQAALAAAPLSEALAGLSELVEH